ncbi:MAG: thioredoxin domain-containing protein, partial [Acidobacteriota bacterium]
MLTFPLCDNQTTVPLSRRLPLSLLAFSLTILGCHAQTPATPGPVVKATVIQGAPVSPELAHRVEVLLRQKAQLPPGSTIHISPQTASELPGYKQISVTFSNDGKTSKPVEFLLSDDGKTLAQFSTYDISADPRAFLSPAGRPSRGGPATAPVIIVGFDDLECPYCARLNSSIFPTLTQRYGDKVHFVYKDFPIEQHPWAMHAALDVNCLAEQSPAGYWNLVDYIHLHSGELGTDPKDPKSEHTLERATIQLDDLTREQAKFQKADLTTLNACIVKQDTKAIEESKNAAIKLGVDVTPVLFINGAKMDGALPVDFIFQMIDDALRAEGV